jgi:phosphoglycolate phosphatase-like HAD superfamily hydrolase
MKPTAIIFDVDGTLCDVSSIRHLVAQGWKHRNFDHFHRASIFCPPFDHVVQAVHAAGAAGHRVLVVTARSDKFRALTTNWLAHHGVPFDSLWMRSHGDWRPDAEVKAEILAEILESFDVIHAFDDNPNVIQLWLDRGIPVTVVPGWEDSVS